MRPAEAEEDKVDGMVFVHSWSLQWIVRTCYGL
jgi:hypothetical protein